MIDHYSPESVRAASLLTNRLVSLDAKPLPAGEFWKLVVRVDPADLVDLDVDGIAELTASTHDEAVRYRTLLDASTALTFEQERLLEGGVSLISALDERFPSVLRERLGTACPPFLLVAGPTEWLDRPGLGVVGSRDAADEALEAARESARMAVEPRLAGRERSRPRCRSGGDGRRARCRWCRGRCPCRGHHAGVAER